MDFERELESLPVWLTVASIVALIWFALSALARVSGWTELAEFYAGGDRLAGASKRFQSMQMGRGGLSMVNFSNVLTLTVTPRALQLSMFFPFDVAAKPLTIPIADLSATPKQVMFFSGVELRAARAPSVIIRLPASVARWIEEQSGARLLAPEMEMAAS